MKCKCGCGGEIVPKHYHKWYGTPEYIPGHHTKGSHINKGKPSNWKGKHPSEETLLKMSESHKGQCGKLAGNWKGGTKLSNARRHHKRRKFGFGFIPLNNPEIDGWVAHHINKDYVIYIPEEIHKSIWHSISKDINMDLINDNVYEWFVDYYLKEIKNGI